MSSHELDGGLVLRHPSGAYLQLNHTGRHLWSLLAGGATRESLTEDLVRTFGIDADTATADVERFVCALREQGLLDES